MRAVSPELRVARGKAGRADHSERDALYGNALPRDPARAPRLKWAQLHMAGPDSLHGHPIYTKTRVALTTTSGVHAATVAEYAITVLLALAHRVPRMVEWQGKGGWPPDEQRWPLFVPTEIHGATLGPGRHGRNGRGPARRGHAAAAVARLGRQ